ncbi:two-component system response regulator YesN [Hydrogenispora ethanolica]|uniref:Two-component system response regulator YesN n=1 Tax=Hydrogenispora ethanolica TaxID=1082276 RepID=A0A4R1R050_HYDET|nr:response regulator [Hydrogenispora ethanolica]TCL58638.1 two-component system response regulator YesN [Hydrogenispora ethanolica]
MPVKVLLADDEPLIVRGLRKLVDWGSLGMELAGEASDGNGAERLLLAEEPDIFISDICMPGKTGIELLKLITERRLRTKVIFLSGYQDFSYAKDALAFGALDYILKPIAKEQLERTLRKAIALIDRESEAAANRDRLLSYESERRKLLQRSLVEGLLDGQPPAPAADYQVCGIAADCPGYTVLVIAIERLGRQAALTPEEQLLKYAVFNLIEQQVSAANSGVTLERGNQLAVILFHHAPGLGQAAALGTAAALKDAVYGRTAAGIVVGRGESVPELAGIAHSCQTALADLAQKIFFGADPTLPEASEPARHRSDDLYPEQKKLIDSLLSHETEAGAGCLARLQTIIRSLAAGDRAAAIGYYLSLVGQVQLELSRFGLAAGPLAPDGPDILKELGDSETFAQLAARAAGYIQGLPGQLAAALKSWETADLRKVKDYIAAHYRENITLETAAAIAFMNPNYFSAFFKKHTGENFKDFLLRVRMEQALRILLTSGAKTYEIAAEVGFNDAKHFSEMFKKYYGKNPLEYKRDLNRG